MAELAGPSVLRQYTVLLRLGFAAARQYRADFVMTAIGALCYEAVSLAFAGVVVHAFGSIGGWGFREVAFVYGIRSMGHALHGLGFGQLWSTDGVVRRGEFDRYLLRPISPLLQLMTRQFQVTAVGDLVFATILLVITGAAAPVSWTAISALYLLAVVIGSGLVEAAVMLAIASLTFRLLVTTPLMRVADSVYVTFGPYPLNIMPRAVSYLLTFLLPLALTAYFPAAILLGRSGGLFVPVWFAGCSPLFGVILFVAAVLFFRQQSRHYSSPGH
ncbi:MAG TPA: ABC-2 family transporter protein [Mycobacteriales bacterium]|nr:ABC-2 family transporter protein [Mycobacteriales bacterium]